jgi:ubiquinone/menaquinone biosynthesis C-methylase UbiE
MTRGRVTTVSTAVSPIGLRPPRRTQDRLAKIFDDEVYPLYAERFADMLLGGLAPGDGRGMVAPGGGDAGGAARAQASVLEVGCGAGATTAELLHRLEAECRIVALDGSPALLDRARNRVGHEHAGRRVFFRQHDLASKLPFAEEAFDLVLANLVLGDVPGIDIEATLADYARVTRPGGRVIVTVPLRGTWAELLDLLREVLLRFDRHDGLDALDAYLAAQPEGEAMAQALERAGLTEVDEELRRWELLFRSGREFFYAPVIEHGPLARWKEIAGKGEPMQEVFLALKEAIDTYYVGHAFAVGIFGGRFSGRKP